METHETLSTSKDPRVRGLIYASVTARNHATSMRENFDRIRDLRERARVRSMIDENEAISDAYLAGAVALEAMRTGIAMRVIIARLCLEAAPSFERWLMAAIGTYIGRDDPGPMTPCRACTPEPAAGNVHSLPRSRPSICLVCEGTGQVPEAIRMLWNDLDAAFESLHAFPPTAVDASATTTHPTEDLR